VDFRIGTEIISSRIPLTVITRNILEEGGFRGDA
jgi:hypothetical protein